MECDKCEAAGLPVEDCPYKKPCNTAEGVAFQIERAVMAERERCAKLVDHILKEGGGSYGDAIRGEKP